MRWRNVDYVAHRRSLPGLAIAVTVVLLLADVAFCGVLSDDGGTVRVQDRHTTRTIRLQPAEPAVAAPATATPATATLAVPAPANPVPQLMAETTSAEVPTTDPSEPPMPVVATSGPAATGGPGAGEASRGTPAVDVPTAALSLLHLDWRPLLPGWRLRFLSGRAGIRGVTLAGEKVIEIYVRRGDGPLRLAHVVAHEIGHAIDLTRLGDGGRRAWMEARGIPTGVAWYPSAPAVPDFATPAGDWAESFAYWQLGHEWYSRLGPPPDASQTALVASLVAGG